MGMTGIVTAVFNRGECFKKMSLSLIYTAVEDFDKWMIIDNSSSDKRIDESLQSIMEVYPEKVIIIRNSENKGHPFAVNQGWQFLSNLWGGNLDYLIDANHDIYFRSEGWLKKAKALLDQYPKIGAIDIAPIEPKGKRRGADGNFEGIPTFSSMQSTLMIIPKRTFDMIGYYSTEFGYWGHEDTDYGRRIQKAGMVIATIPEIEIDHLQEGSENQGHLKWKYLGRNIDILEKRTKGGIIYQGFDEKRDIPNLVL